MSTVACRITQKEFPEKPTESCFLGKILDNFHMRMRDRESKSSLQLYIILSP